MKNRDLIEFLTKRGFNSFKYKKKPIYVLPTKLDPINSLADWSILEAMAKEKAYIIVTKASEGKSGNRTTLYAFDEENHLKKFPPFEDLEEIEKVLSGNATYREKGIDFYYMFNLPENPVDYIQNVGGNNQYAYLLTDNNLLLVDRISNKYVKLSIRDYQLENLKNKLNIFLEQGSKIKEKKLTEAELVYIPNHELNVQLLLDPFRPINESMDPKIGESISSIIALEIAKANAIYNKEVVPINNQVIYYLYRAYQIAPSDYYPANHGDFLSGSFSTFQEEGDPIQVIEEMIQETIGDKNWIEDKMDETILNPEWWANTIINSYIYLNRHIHGQLPSTGGGSAQNQMSSASGTHTKMIIEPRIGKVFTLVEPIPFDDFRLEGQRGSIVNTNFAVGNPSINLANIWIISDVTPQKIHQKKHLQVTPKNSTFIFFSEQDANVCMEKMIKYYKNNKELLGISKISFKNIHSHPIIQMRAMTLIAQAYVAKLSMFEKIFEELIERQTQYITDYSQIDTGALHSTIGRNKQYLALAIRGKNYPHFLKIE